MATFTAELSSIVCAYANLVDPTTNYDKVVIKGIEYGNEAVADFEYDTHDFAYDPLLTPNSIIDHFAYNCFMKHTGGLIQNFTDNNDLNTQIMTQLINTFCRHFWGYEIGQENPLYWWVLVKGFFDEQMPLFIQEYQEMMIKKQNFITGLSHLKSDSTGNLKNKTVGVNDSANNTLSAHADTPQNELDFSLNSSDPTKDYHFAYSSNVDGGKSSAFAKATNDTNQDTTNQTVSDNYSRSQTIMSLVNQLNAFSNGMYLELFAKAKQYGLFMSVF